MSLLCSTQTGSRHYWDFTTGLRAILCYLKGDHTIYSSQLSDNHTLYRESHWVCQAKYDWRDRTETRQLGFIAWIPGPRIRVR